MICLAVNTANMLMSVAIVSGDGAVMYSFETSEMRDQGNLLLQHVEKGLETAGIGYSDLGLLAVVTGPGSFTGIRLGLAAMRAIALAAQKPLIGVSSFELFAEQAEGLENLIAIESWREELYLQLGDAKAVNVTPEDFTAAVDKKPYLISGDARDKMAALLPGSTLSTDKGHAVKAAAIALKRFAETGEGDKPEPYYLRDADISVSTKIRKTTIV